MANLIHLSVLAELSFPEVQPETFTSHDVTFKGAELGDVVQLTEPFQRPAGITFFAYVSATETVKVCAKNKTGETISAPLAAYGLIITKD